MCSQWVSERVSYSRKKNCERILVRMNLEQADQLYNMGASCIYMQVKTATPSAYPPYAVGTYSDHAQ